MPVSIEKLQIGLALLIFGSSICVIFF